MNGFAGAGRFSCPPMEKRRGCFTRRRKRALALALALLLALLLAAALLERNLKPILLSTAASRVRAIALDAVNTAVSQSLGAVTYEDLVHIQCDAEGNVTLLQADTVNMSRLSTATALTAQQYIADIAEQSIRISIGSAFGSPLLAGRGPEVVVKVVPVGSVSSEFVTEFRAAGINQTRHRVYVRLRAAMRIVIPMGAEEVEVLSQVPVAETVIVGRVPQSYVNVDSREDMLNLLPDMSGT